MRPVEKTIKDPEGNPIDRVYMPYGKAKPDLTDKLGKYCSYCEVTVPPIAELDVEHVEDKDTYPAKEHSWNNFLLSCTVCNSIKGGRLNGLLNYHLPHLNNTFLSFQVLERGLLLVNPLLTGIEQQKATALFDLFKIGRTEGIPDLSPADDRWANRMEAWKLAVRHFHQNSDIETVVDLAAAKGFFTVWMTVFESRPDVRRALIDAFPGTAISCFDPITTIPTNRNGTAI